MAWDFTADSEKQTEIAKKISDAADKFDEKVDAMYSQIGNMGTYWVGEDYNAYKEGTEGYRNALSDLSDSLRMYSKHFEKVASSTEVLTQNLVTTINGLTGTNDSGSGNGTSGDGSTPSGAGAGRADVLNGSNVNGNIETPTGNPTGGNVTNNETPGNPSGDKTSNTPVEGTTNNVGNKPSSVTVSSGQEVTVNGEKCYFLMRDSSGNEYYTKSTDANAQVFIRGENNSLSPYESYGNGKIVSREDFVNDRKHNLDYQWNVTYNNGSNPYDSIGSNVDSSFTANVDHPDYTYVNYDSEYLKSNATTLDQFDRGSYSLETADTMPDVLYIAPGQSIKYDKPWDTYNNVIEGGSEGKYMIYDSSKNAYFVLDNNSYKTKNEGTFGLWISNDQLFDERTSINK
ncbi:MAG TPA: hypothetical protein DCE23_00075 [Firmicutes bacterium]|nr:hypothetical protein [Bacillota bacterium]